MFTISIFCLTISALVLGFGLGIKPSPGGIKRIWRRRLIIGGLIGLLCGVLLMLAAFYI